MRDSPRGSPYRARDLPLYLCGRFLSNLAMMVQSVAVGWQIYDIVGSPLALGLVGLAVFAPMFLLTLPAGEIADRFDQRKILTLSFMVEALCSAVLLALATAHVRSAWPLYAVMVPFGCARGFAGPASRSLVSLLVPPERLPQAIAWASSVSQVAVIAGPALGGFAYALGPPAAYGLCLVAFGVAALGTALLKGRTPRFDQTLLAGRIERVKEGVRFVRSRPVVFGAISLDLFAVLLGGATALLPIYARDMLQVGPTGLGMLRSAPALGATVVALTLTRLPLERHIGARLFMAVGAFGLATIVFGVSRSFTVSLLALVALGASDQVSVYIRSTLVQLATPDSMRGRVSAVSTLFIGASNELGEFESGVTAALFGTVPAVVLGGLGTLAVVAVWMRAFPALRTVDRLADVVPTADSAPQGAPGSVRLQ
jgi:MFS family permease